jgi:metal-responsive CopG/Arc/MetJ family transcriptional regulator
MVAHHNYLDNIVLYKGERRYLCKSVMEAQHNYLDNYIITEVHIVIAQYYLDICVVLP